MKKVLMAVAVLMIASLPLTAAEVFSSDTASLSVGGRIKTAAGYSDGDFAWEDGGSRITIAGEKILADGVTAFATYEFGFNSLDPSKAPSLRLGHVGVDFNGHTITAGRQWSMYDDFAGMADYTEWNGGASNANEGVLGGGRGNALQYAGSFGVVSFGADVQYDEAYNNDWAASGAIAADLGALNVAFATSYAANPFYTDENGKTTDAYDNTVVMVLGAEYSVLDNLSIAATGSFQMFDDVYKIGQEAGINFVFDGNGSNVFFGNNFVYNLDAGEVEMNFLSLGAAYRILPGSGFYVFCEAMFDLDEIEDSEFWAGVRYSF